MYCWFGSLFPQTESALSTEQVRRDGRSLVGRARADCKGQAGGVGYLPGDAGDQMLELACRSAISQYGRDECRSVAGSGQRG